VHLDIWLLLGATLVLCAIIAVRLSHKAGLPTLLAYMALGLFIGESGPLHLHFYEPELA
jgi:cell volume regulation protein A